MASKGSYAKEKIIQFIKEKFGEDYIGEFDKKYYVWISDGGSEKIQMAISITAPKVYRGTEESALSSSDTTSASTFTKEEEETLEELMSKLGL